MVMSQGLRNHTSVNQSITISAARIFDRWDDNASVIITSNGNTTYKVSVQLSALVGPVPR